MSSMLRQVAPGVHTLDRPLRFLGVELGARMTVLDTGNGLLLHSPIDCSPQALAELGEVRWALAPNTFHHLFIGTWADRGVEVWAAPGLDRKRSDVEFAGLVTDGAQPFGNTIQTLTLKSFPLTNEVVLFHEPSQTLVVTDLLFNLSSDAPWLTRASMFCACAYPGCKSSVLERVGMRRSVARIELRQILEWDFTRIVLAHGDVVETDAKAKFAAAYTWLGL